MHADTWIEDKEGHWSQTLNQSDSGNWAGAKS